MFINTSVEPTRGGRSGCMHPFTHMCAVKPICVKAAQIQTESPRAHSYKYTGGGKGAAVLNAIVGLPI